MLTEEEHLNAGRIYGEDATCGGITKQKKINYKSHASAWKAAKAMMPKARNKLEAYPCYWCNGWHIGREMIYEEYQALIREE